MKRPLSESKTIKAVFRFKSDIDGKSETPFVKDMRKMLSLPEDTKLLLKEYLQELWIHCEEAGLRDHQDFRDLLYSLEDGNRPLWSTAQSDLTNAILITVGRCGGFTSLFRKRLSMGLIILTENMRLLENKRLQPNGGKLPTIHDDLGMSLLKRRPQPIIEIALHHMATREKIIYSDFYIEMTTMLSDHDSCLEFTYKFLGELHEMTLSVLSEKKPDTLAYEILLTIIDTLRKRSFVGVRSQELRKYSIKPLIERGLTETKSVCPPEKLVGVEEALKCLFARLTMG